MRQVCHFAAAIACVSGCTAPPSGSSLNAAATQAAPIGKFTPYHHIADVANAGDGPDLCKYPDGTGDKQIHCYDPATFLGAYGIDQLHSIGITGKGQTIILVDSFGSPTMQADLDHFSDTFGLPRTTIEFVYPDGPYVNPMTDKDQIGWAQETTLDLEWAHAVAPDAKLVNVISNTSETTGVTGLPDLFLGIQQALRKYPGAIVSMSFGTGEPTFTSQEIDQYVKGSFHDVFQAASDAGATLLGAAGDSGSTNENLADTAYIATPNAGYPASDPLVTAVGGTALEVNWLWTPEGTADDYWTCTLAGTSPCPKNIFKSAENSRGIVETVWKEDWAPAAGGGGVSTIFTEPAYQRGVASDAQATMNGFRGVPDLALNAAINGGVMLYTTFAQSVGTAPAPLWSSTGGTSCAAPEMAGLVALAGQRASDQLGQPVSIGYLNPLLYGLPDADFRAIMPTVFGTDQQITIQDNSLYFSAAVLAKMGPLVVPPAAVPGYQTDLGYNLATGRGAPLAVGFVLDIAQARINQIQSGNP